MTFSNGSHSGPADGGDAKAAAADDASTAARAAAAPRSGAGAAERAAAAAAAAEDDDRHYRELAVLGAAAHAAHLAKPRGARARATAVSVVRRLNGYIAFAPMIVAACVPNIQHGLLAAACVAAFNLASSGALRAAGVYRVSGFVRRRGGAAAAGVDHSGRFEWRRGVGRVLAAFEPSNPKCLFQPQICLLRNNSTAQQHNKQQTTQLQRRQTPGLAQGDRRLQRRRVPLPLRRRVDAAAPHGAAQAAAQHGAHGVLLFGGAAARAPLLRGVLARVGARRGARARARAQPPPPRWRLPCFEPPAPPFCPLAREEPPLLPPRARPAPAT